MKSKSSKIPRKLSKKKDTRWYFEQHHKFWKKMTFNARESREEGSFYIFSNSKHTNESQRFLKK